MTSLTHTPIANTKLSVWYFAVSWAAQVLQQRITESERLGLPTSYDMHQLAQLQDLEQFLKMSWDQWLDTIAPTHNAQEAK